MTAGNMRRVDGTVNRKPTHPLIDTIFLYWHIYKQLEPLSNRSAPSDSTTPIFSNKCPKLLRLSSIFRLSLIIFCNTKKTQEWIAPNKFAHQNIKNYEIVEIELQKKI